MRLFELLKKGGSLGNAWRKRGNKAYLVVNQEGYPWAVDVAPANTAEVYASRGVVRKVPKGKWLTGDRAYDIPSFRAWLQEKKIKANIRYKAKAWRAGKEIRRQAALPTENPITYQARFAVERAFAWFEKFKRLNLRYERHLYLYKAFWQLGAAVILFQHFTR